MVEWIPSAPTIRSALCLVPSLSSKDPSELSMLSTAVANLIEMGFPSPSDASLKSSLWRSIRCTDMNAKPYLAAQSLKSKDDNGFKVRPSTDSQEDSGQILARSKENPRDERTQDPLGVRPSAAPVSVKNRDFSKILSWVSSTCCVSADYSTPTFTEWPACRKATAAQRPPIPAPTIAMVRGIALGSWL